MTETQKGEINEKNVPFSRIGKLIFIKMSMIFNAIYTFNADHVEILMFS
jgi:hypothetical protein